MYKSVLVRDVDPVAHAALLAYAMLKRVTFEVVLRGLIEGTSCPWPGCTHTHEWNVDLRAREPGNR